MQNLMHLIPLSIISIALCIALINFSYRNLSYNHGDGRSIRIYVYDLPDTLNGGTPLIESVKSRSVSGFVSNYVSFSTEMKLHELIATRSGHISGADLFYVPFYSGLLLHASPHRNSTREATIRLLEETIDYINLNFNNNFKKYPEKHVWMFSHLQGSCFDIIDSRNGTAYDRIRNLISGSIVLQHAFNKCFQPNSDIIIPPFIIQSNKTLNQTTNEMGDKQLLLFSVIFRGRNTAESGGLHSTRDSNENDLLQAVDIFYGDSSDNETIYYNKIENLEKEVILNSCGNMNWQNFISCATGCNVEIERERVYSRGVRQRLYLLYQESELDDSDSDIKNNFNGNKETENIYSNTIKDQTFGDLIHISVHSDRLSFEEYMKELRQATFCIVISGFSNWNLRLYESLMSGCIPVFITPSTTSGDGDGYRHEDRYYYNYPVFSLPSLVHFNRSEFRLDGDSMLECGRNEAGGNGYRSQCSWADISITIPDSDTSNIGTLLSHFIRTQSMQFNKLRKNVAAISTSLNTEGDGVTTFTQLFYPQSSNSKSIYDDNDASSKESNNSENIDNSKEVNALSRLLLILERKVLGASYSTPSATTSNNNINNNNNNNNNNNFDTNSNSNNYPLHLSFEDYLSETNSKLDFSNNNDNENSDANRPLTTAFQRLWSNGGYRGVICYITHMEATKENFIRLRKLYETLWIHGCFTIAIWMPVLKIYQHQRNNDDLIEILSREEIILQLKEIDGDYQRIKYTIVSEIDILTSWTKKFSRATMYYSLLADAIHTGIVNDNEELKHLFDLNYPVNILRNKAMDMCESEYGFLVPSLDFSPSLNLESILLSLRNLISKKEFSDSDNAIIIPSFEWKNSRSIINKLKPTLQNEQEIPQTYDKLKKLLKMDMVQFHSIDSFYYSQSAISLDKWLKSSRLSLTEYRWGLGASILIKMPFIPYDESFFGKDTAGHASLIHSMAIRGYQLHLVPKQFMFYAPISISSNLNRPDFDLTVGWSCWRQYLVKSRQEQHAYSNDNSGIKVFEEPCWSSLLFRVVNLSWKSYCYSDVFKLVLNNLNLTLHATSNDHWNTRYSNNDNISSSNITNEVYSIISRQILNQNKIMVAHGNLYEPDALWLNTDEE